MKKNLLAGLLLLWACSVYGQKRIVDPVRSDFSYVAKFDRVEITGKRTVAEVTLRYLPNYWIRYDSLTTYLQDCGSDRRYRLLAAEGFELNKEVYMPESGEMKARFIFDPVDADVRCVDFIDPSWKKSHKYVRNFSGEIGETFGTAGLGVGKLVDDGRFEPVGLRFSAADGGVAERFLGLRNGDPQRENAVCAA